MMGPEVALRNFESLETRLLLSVTASLDGSKKLTISDNSGGNDVIVISLSAGNTLSVSVGGVNIYSQASANLLANLASIEVQAGAGNDSVNLGATTKAITTPTTLNGSSGA